MPSSATKHPSHDPDATRFAETQAATLRRSALSEMNHLLNHEVERLQMLRLVNDHIRPQEIKMAQAQQQSWGPPCNSPVSAGCFAPYLERSAGSLEVNQVSGVALSQSTPQNPISLPSAGTVERVLN